MNPTNISQFITENINENNGLILEKCKEWIGVDLDSTLAYHDGWKGIDHIGEPIPAMLRKVKQALKDGKYIKIFTARVSSKQGDPKEAEKHIKAWCKKHIGRVLPITNEKDPFMKELWDDRAKQVKKNKGTFIK